METTAGNNNNNNQRLSSAKWSRNLNQDCQSESNRLRLLERQRQLIESKLQRRQLNQQNENIIIPSLSSPNSSQSSTSSSASTIRPATSIGNLRSGINSNSSIGGSPSSNPRSSTTDSSDSIFQRNHFNYDLDDNNDGGDNQNDNNKIIKNRMMIKNRARTSVPGSRQQIDNHNQLQQQQQQTKLSTNKFLQEQKNDKFLANNNNNNSRSSSALHRSTMSKSEINLQQLSNTNEQNTTTTAIEQKLSMPNPLINVLTDEELLKFVTQPISPDVTLQCTIIRDKKGLDRSLYPTYYMHLQDIVLNNNLLPTMNKSLSSMQLDNKRNQQQQQQIEGTATVWMSDSLESINSTNDDSLTTDDEQQQQQQQNTNNSSSTTTTPSSKKVFVLSGRRRKKSKTYLIGNNAFDISRDRCIAKLKSNVLGTQFTSIRLHSNGVRHEISSITYETNVLGFKGPRKMTIIIPKPDEKTNALCNLSLQEELKRNSRAIMLLKNKTPIWNEETQSYVLNFHGRVTQASVKNFQLVVQNANNNDGNNRKSNNNNNSADDQAILRRSASSHQLRHNSKLYNNPDDNDDDDDDDDDGGNSNEDSDSDSVSNNDGNNNDDSDNDNDKNTKKKSKKSSLGLRKNHPISKSGYLMATSSEDAKQIADYSNDLVSLQFGRVSNTHFSCDVSWPLSLLQAFAIALSSFDSKLACE
ncbi:tub domain-containing protein ktub [Dermatophagoides pteronyssinus]|uniref:tub domain-containing protein ktub n=1 Tax=Dermatophagoides pteronyssinus TaxID=6956 RepID=UPI003F6735E6